MMFLLLKYQRDAEPKLSSRSRPQTEPMLAENNYVSPEVRAENQVSRTTAPGVDYAHLVRSVRAGDDDAAAELYRVLRKGIRCLLLKSLNSQHVDDFVQETFLTVVKAIQTDQVRCPEILPAFVRGVVWNLTSAHRRSNWTRRRVDLESIPEPQAHGGTPEEHLAAQERTAVVKAVIASLSEKQREILNRFYFLGQSPEQIIVEMKLTPVQFRLLKWRAKARFVELAQRKLKLRGMPMYAGAPEDC